MPIPFHLAIPVHDLDAARRFYVGTLGCGEGRCGADWLDLNFFGHQVVVHVMPAGAPQSLVKVGVNEQASMMLHDPSGNAIELKAFADVDRLFAT